MNPQIGIVVPVGRFSHSLDMTLSSLISQEVDIAIAVYDASEDPKTKTVIEKFGEHLHHVHYGPDGGQSNAILMGWEKLNTEIVGWLNDDDHLGPGTLKTVIDLFNKNPDHVGVFGPSVILNEKGDFSGMHPEVNPQRLNEIFSNNTISQPSCFVKYDKVKQIGGINKDLEYTMDWDLWARLLDQYPNSFIYSDDIISAVIFSNQTKTSTISFKRLSEIYALTRRYNPVMRSLITLFSFFKWGIIQKFKPGNVDFHKSQSDPYSYWNYNKEIYGIRLYGALTSQDIKSVLQQRNITLNTSSKDSTEFTFEKAITPGTFVKLNLTNINFTSLDFILEKT